MSESTTVTEYAVRITTGEGVVTEIEWDSLAQAERFAVSVRELSPAVVQRIVTTTRWEPVTGEEER